MSEYIPMQDNIANSSTLKLVANSLQTSPNIRQKFDNEQLLRNYLFTQPLPELIIKIIGINEKQMKYSYRASIQNAFKQVMSTLMKQTNIWLLNGTRSMIDLEELEQNSIEYEEQNPNIIMCESFGKSQLFIYDSRKSQDIDRILLEIQQQASSRITTIALLMQGNGSSVLDINDNLNRYIPTIILRGTGLIANQIAAVFVPIRRDLKTIHRELSNEDLLSETELRRLNPKNDDARTFVFVCQPGKDELDEYFLRAINAGIKIHDDSQARITEFIFSMRWNKFHYAQEFILNHYTIINWTNFELDICLEQAILMNAVTFVELLFQYGASLERLALTGSPDRFKIKREEVRGSSIMNIRNISFNIESQVIELMFERIPVITHLDTNQRMKAYFRDVFYWSVTHQYYKLIMSIITRLEDSITGMLLVSQWCQFHEQIDFLTPGDYAKHRSQFEMHAAEILDLCYLDNKEYTIESLDDRSDLYSEQKPLILIDDLCSKALVSTKCMQSNMNTRWYGDHFHKDKNFIWELLVFSVCICPLLLFIPFIRNRVLRWDDIEHRRNTCWGRITSKFEPFRRFYQGNAAIRFRYNLASYAVFLILFSYTILFDYYPLNIYGEERSNIYRLPIPITEIVVHIFLASIALEEIRQIIIHVKSSLNKSSYWNILANKHRYRNTIWSFYRADPWNVLDFIAFILWFIGFITRFIVKEHVFEVSKICMSIDLCLWYMRCLHVFIVSERLGPKLLMIFHTMIDLTSFLFFLLIFLLAYAITTYSLISTSSFVIWENSTYFRTIQDGGNSTNIGIIRNIIEWGTWKIFGSTSLETTSLDNIKYSAQNDAYGFVTLILTIIFLVIAYVLLLNNLIALFNFTIQRVHGESHSAWCYHFYIVLQEYEDKDMFIPPFNLIFWPVSYCMRKKSHKKKRSDTYIRDENKNRIRRHQQKIAEKYWKEKQIDKNGAITQRPYVCRQCKVRGTEADYIESSFL